MTKWLAFAGIAVLALLIVLWKQLDASSATAAPPPAKAAVTPVTAPIEALPRVAAAPVEDEEPAPEEGPTKIEVESDEFFYRFQEAIPAKLTSNAVKCYEGISKRVHRNNELVLGYKIRIKDGAVTVHDVKIETDTLDNPALTSCFMQEIQRTTWTDDVLPDWEAENQITLSPERGMKKYTRANREYVGEPAPRD